MWPVLTSALLLKNPYSMFPVTGRAKRSIGSLSVSFRDERLCRVSLAFSMVLRSGLAVGTVRLGFSGRMSTGCARGGRVGRRGQAVRVRVGGR